jgi:integrase
MNGFSSTGEGQLFDINGMRKYLTSNEVKALLAAARKAERQTRLFCKLFYYTGARLSEGLQVTRRRLDVDTGRIIFRTLKRRKTIYRAVPVPRRFMSELVAFAATLEPDARLFPWSRQTGWRRIKAVVNATGIEGPQATAKGFRHQYACRAIGCGLPEALVSRMLGHASPKSTSVYTFVIDAEERALVRRMW